MNSLELSSSSFLVDRCISEYQHFSHVSNMGFLQRKLSCFYCGRASSQSWKPGLVSFHCTVCDATNYLDSNGDITDPPVSTTASTLNARRYVQTSFQSRSPSPITVPGSSGSIFCHTCTSNQQFVAQALAEYLPPPSDPRYREYEKTLPEYKRQLEGRYPQVCADCEPQVQAQIQAAGYTARTDYIRRMNDKSRKAGIHSAHFWTSRRSFGIIAGFLWFFVLFVQIAWNILGVLAEREMGFRAEDKPSLRTCASQCLNDLAAEASCVDLFTPFVKQSLLFNVLIIWWNPILLRSTRRARGVGEFYKLQALLLGLRLASWNMLTRDSNNLLERDTNRAIHGFMLTLNLIISVVALSTARPLPHLVRFHKDDDAAGLLVDQTRGSLQVKKSEAVQLDQYPSSKRAFPITNLAEVTVTPTKKNTLVNNLDTSPPKLSSYIEEDIDAMDLDTPDGNMKQTGGQNFFRDTPTMKTSRSRGQKADFRPPAPLQKPTSTRQLRSRTRQTRPATERKDSFATGWDVETIASHADEDALTIRAEDDSDESTLHTKFVPASAKNQQSYDFKAARLHSDTAETGLEGMLGFFGLKDDPLLEVTASEPAVATKQPAEKTTTTIFSVPGASPRRRAPSRDSHEKAEARSVILALLSYPVIALILFTFGPSSCLLDCLRESATWWCGVVAAIRLFDSLSPQRPIWELSSILTLALQSMTAVGLGYARFRTLQKENFLAATATGPEDPVAMEGVEGIDTSLGNDPVLPEDATMNEMSKVVNIKAVATVLLIWTIGQELTTLLRILHRRRKMSAQITR